MFSLYCLSEDLPAVLGQDDLGLGCPLLHLAKVSRVTESAQSLLSVQLQKEFEHFHRQREIQGFFQGNICDFFLRRHLN